VVIEANDFDLPYGAGGLYSWAGQVSFDNLQMYGPCDDSGAGCRGLSANQSCSFSCLPGYRANGGLNIMCNNAGLFASTLTCDAIPPIVKNYTVTLYDDSPSNYLLVTVNATPVAAGQTVTYDLQQQENFAVVKDRFNPAIVTTTNGIFTVGLCSGDFRLATGGVIDYYLGQKFYPIRIRALINGISTIYAEFIVNVTVLPGPKPPVFARVNGTSTRYTRTINENVAVGTQVTGGAIVAAKDDGLPVVYDIIFGNQNNAFAISTGGMLTANTAGLNYEGQNLYTLIVRARDANRTDLSDQIFTDVVINDVNDKPLIKNLNITLAETLATVTVNDSDVNSWVIPASDEDSGDYITYSLTSQPPANTWNPAGIAFNISATTGRVTIIRNLKQDYSDHLVNKPQVVDGLLVRAVFDLVVRVTDSHAAWSENKVRIYLLADSSQDQVPVITGITSGTLSTLGNDGIRFQGEFLNVTLDSITKANTLQCNYSTTAGDASGNRTYIATNCQVTSPTDGNCTSAPGWGVNLALSCVYGSTRQPVLFKNGAQGGVFTLSYSAPVTTSVVSPKDVLFPYVPPNDFLNDTLTEGGQILKVIGTNFGPASAPRTVKYGASLEYTASVIPNSAGETPDTAIRFITLPGVGRNLPVVVIVGTQQSASQPNVAFSYVPPSVTGVTRVGGAPATGMSTLGSEDFVITGTGFGPLNSVPSVWYGSTQTQMIEGHLSNTSLQFSYTPSNCRKSATNPGSAVTCSSAAGVGAGHGFRLIIGGQTTGFVSTSTVQFSYAKPSVTSVDGPGARNADTAGGQSVTIQGNNFGPKDGSLGDGTPGTLNFAPLSITYGPASNPYLYVATGCSVTFASGTISCFSAPGTGAGYVWSVLVGNQSAPIFGANSSYGAPVISQFTKTQLSADPDAVKHYFTSGAEFIYIAGKNFGASINPSKFDARYRTSVVDRRTEYGGVIGDANGDIWMSNVVCVMITPHTMIRCTTIAGAGANMQWLITVDGQVSSIPVAAYSAPSIGAIRDKTSNMTVNAANTDGGDVVTLIGQNFGPGCSTTSVYCRGLVQTLRYGRTGTEYALVDYNVTGHTTIDVRLNPGFGTNLVFVVVVAGQSSEASTESFSYATPQITSVSPSRGPTDPAQQLLVTVTGRHFSLLDPNARIRLYVGNPSDTTLGTPISDGGIMNKRPSLSDPRWAVGYTFGDIHSFQFLLPAGVLPQRGVRIEVFSGSMSVTSSVYADNSTISYFDPVITNVVVQLATESNANASKALFQTVLGKAFNSQPFFMVTISGSNFGPAASMSSLPTRVIEARDNTDPMSVFSAKQLSPNQQYSNFLFEVWDQNTIKAFTLLDHAALRIKITGSNYNGSQVLEVNSNSVSYLRVSPGINALVGQDTTRFNTAGGDYYRLDATALDAVQTVLNLQVQSLVFAATQRKCEIVLTDDTLAGTDANVITTIVQNGCAVTPSYCNQPVVNATTIWHLRCRMPPGQGTGVQNQIVLFRDLAISNPQPIGYAPPAITRISVLDPATNAWNDVMVSGPLQVTVTSTTTDETRIRFYGSNFGLCSKVMFSAGDSDAYRLGYAYSLPAPNAVLAVECNATTGITYTTNAQHTFLELPLPAGEGTGFSNGLGFTLQVVAGDQNSTTVLLRYPPPIVTDMTSTGTTRGGTLITINGFNFGQKALAVQIGRATTVQGETTAPGFQNCTNVVRISSKRITCLSPSGTGVGLRVRVFSADQMTEPSNVLFSYLAPTVASYRVNGSALTSYTVGGPFLSGPTTGSYVVELYGDNFGDNNTLWTDRCMFVAWTGRDLSRQHSCNNSIDFAGEGELPSSGIVAWNHSYIAFRMPPGHGLREIFPLVRTQQPANAPQFAYAAPAITGELVPSLLSTDGQQDMKITGANFGPADAPRSSVTYPVTLPATWNQYVALPWPHNHALRVNFHRGCIVNTPGLTKFVGVCASSITSVDHNEMHITSLPGIGRNRVLNVTVHDVRVTNGQTETVTMPSNSVFFHYMPPVILVTLPRPVRMDGADGKVLSVRGSNFGVPPQPSDQNQWSEDELFVAVTVGGRAMPTAERTTVQGQQMVQTHIPNLPVGFYNLSVVVAGQTGNASADVQESVFAACDNGFWGRPGELCLPCPLNGDAAVCKGFASDQRSLLAPGGTAEGTHTYPVPRAGFYDLNSTSGMNASCPPQIVIAGRDSCIVSCDPPEACLPGNLCSDAYRSIPPLFRCGTCNIGFYRRNAECVKCPDSPYALVIGFVLLVVAVAVVGYILNKKKINIAFISIGVDYFQVLAIFAQSKVAWPEAIKNLFHILSAFNLNIEIVSPDCIVPDITFKQKWIFVMLLPICIFGMFMLVHLGQVGYKYCVLGRRKDLFKHQGALAAAGLALFYLLYLYLTRTILEVFNCAPTSPIDDGYTYMAGTLERCDQPGGTQATLVPLAVIALLAYTVGYPAFLAQLFWRKRVLIMEDQLLRAKGVGQDRLTNPHAYGIRKAYR
jgi:hypothetical protein